MLDVASSVLSCRSHVDPPQGHPKSDHYLPFWKRLLLWQVFRPAGYPKSREESRGVKWGSSWVLSAVCWALGSSSAAG